MTVAASPEVMLAKLRPDRPGPTWQHVAPVSARRVPPVVVTYCGGRLRAIDIDPRYVHRLTGSACPVCVRNTPSEVLVYLARVSGALFPADEVGETTRPVPVSVVYASGLAALQVRHIVPEGSARWTYQDRMVLAVECGHMAWCPVTGPWPSSDWPVCSECLASIYRRTAARPGTPPSP